MSYQRKEVIGNATLYLGDCLDVMPLLPDHSVDMVLADLPYGITSCSWDVAIPFEPLWREYRRVSKPDAAIVLTASQPFTSALVMSNPREFRHSWVYRKRVPSNFAQAKFAPMKEHEDVLVFSRTRSRYFPIMEERQGRGASRTKYAFKASNHRPDDFVGPMRGQPSPTRGKLRYPSSVREINNLAAGDRGLHRTQKPVALKEYLVRTYTQPGELVLDNTMGSGTTGIACLNSDRRFIGIEKDPQIFEIARARIARAIGDDCGPLFMGAAA